MKLYTIGYGNVEGKTHQAKRDNFIALLRYIEFATRTKDTKGLIIVDVRKEGCGSRNGKWAAWGAVGMGHTVRMIHGGVYLTVPGLANDPRMGFRKYRGWLEEAIISGSPVTVSAREGFHTIIDLLKTSELPVILLCAERVGLGEKGTLCHRVIIAEMVKERTGCEVIHL